MEKRNITKEELAEVKKIDLLTYLSNYQPDELVKYSYNDYGTKTHSSLHIANGMWRYYAGGINGRSALDYLIKIENMKFLDASLYIHSLIMNKTPTIVKPTSSTYEPKGDLKLPQSYINNDRIIQYLSDERCIDAEVIQTYIDKKMIYEAKYDHSIIFVGFNIFGEARFGSKRGIDNHERRDLSGSNKHFSFSVADEFSNDLYIYESPIEMMSNQTLLKMSGNNWQEHNHVSLGGVTGIGECGIENTKLPVALTTFLEKNKQIKTIHVCTNSDKAGYETFQKIHYHLSDTYSVYNEIPKTHNDINDVLRDKKKTKYKQYER
ncbi:MAG: DUF3991 domain-containing protein [Bacilli bacterium]